MTDHNADARKKVERVGCCSKYFANGKFNHTDRCKINALTAENAKLTAENVKLRDKLEDAQDLLVIEKRKDEPSFPLGEVEARLIRDGLLPAPENPVCPNCFDTGFIMQDCFCKTQLPPDMIVTTEGTGEVQQYPPQPDTSAGDPNYGRSKTISESKNE